MTTPDKDALQDPVCAMLVQPDNPQRFAYKGQDFVFCCPRCLALFQNQPERYLEPSADKPEKAEAPTTGETEGAPETYLTCPMHPEVREPMPGACPKCGMALEPASAPAAPVTKTEWTCPMHPEVVQDSPGSCPKCGMALEPRTVPAAEEENAELRDMRRRFWVAVALTVPVVVIAMGHLIPGHPLQRLASSHAWGWVELGLATPVGVLFKNAEAIEVMRQIDTLVVDKTGTLTEGKPKLRPLRKSHVG